MLGSVDTPFAIRSLLIIDPEAGHNNSVRLLNPALKTRVSIGIGFTILLLTTLMETS